MSSGGRSSPVKRPPPEPWGITPGRTRDSRSCRWPRSRVNLPTRVAIPRATSTPVVLFRPPYEADGPRVNRIVRHAGLLEVLWNIDSRDWEDGPLTTIERNLRHLRPGAIILFHEQGKRTLPALRWLLGDLRRRNLRPVTVPDLLATDGPDRQQLSLDARARSCAQRATTA
jgi:hypothetical protein